MAADLLWIFGDESLRFWELHGVLGGRAEDGMRVR